LFILDASNGNTVDTYDEPSGYPTHLYSVDKDGKLFVSFSEIEGTGGGRFVSLNQDCTENWSYGLRYCSKPVISDGVVYVIGVDELYNVKLYAFK